jgi:hypothetical protein
MKAIVTKYFGPTDTKGSRIKASDEDGNSITIPYDYALSGEALHKKAAIALCEKMHWDGNLITQGEKAEARVEKTKQNDRKANIAVTLPIFQGYTVDEKLREFRKILPGRKMEFVPFDSERGVQLRSEMRNVAQRAIKPAAMNTAIRRAANAHGG